jgi:hypothetical protein
MDRLVVGEQKKKEENKLKNKSHIFCTLKSQISDWALTPEQAMIV